MRIYVLVLAWVSIIRSDGDVSYPRKVYGSECEDLFRQGALLSFAVNVSGCTTTHQTEPPIKVHNFGEEIRHGSYVVWGPENNLTYWRQRYVDNRDVKRVGPVLRTTGVQMDFTGYAYVTIQDFDPRKMTSLALLKMECRGDNGGFTPYAQTPGGQLLKFGDIKGELAKGSLLFYSIYTNWCDPRPKNLTHIYVYAGPLDEYRFDPSGDLVFTYRTQYPGLSLDITTVKMTSASDITMETYRYSQVDDKAGPLLTKKCTYGPDTFFGIYKITSPQGLQL